MHMIIALAPLALVAACAQASSADGPDARETAAAPVEPDRSAVTLPGKPDAEERARGAGNGDLVDMRPTDGGGATEEECTNSIGAENSCIQGNYRPLPEPQDR